MSKNLFLLMIIAVVYVSCKSAESKAPQMAADFCKCFEEIQSNISDNTMKIFKKASGSANPEKALEEAMEELNEEEQLNVAMELSALDDMDNEQSEIGRCIKNVEKKYNNAYTLNEKKFVGMIIKELETKPGCDFTATLLKLGTKIEENDK